MNTYFKSFINRAAYEAYENTEDLFIAYIEDTGDVIYVDDNPATTPFTVTALEDNLTINTLNFTYSLDNGETWNRDNNSISVNTGDSVMFKGELAQHPGDGWGANFCSGNFAVSGNLMSLIYGHGDFYGTYLPSSMGGGEMVSYFDRMFNNCQNIIDASGLIFPDNTVSYCYEYMFYNAHYLRHAPKRLPAPFGERCYFYMFGECYDLLDTPVIECDPNSVLRNNSNSACRGMFYNCSSLVDLNIKSLSSVEFNDEQYREMFKNCTSLITAENLDLGNIYGSWASHYEMFRGCTSLTTTCKLNGYGGNQSAQYMFADCSSLTDASRIHIEKRSQFDNGPYDGMFYGCSSLEAVEIYGPEWPDLSDAFLDGAGSNGTFTVPASTNYDPNNYIGNGIPSDWTIARAS